jgi:hypothetical protein
MIVKSRSCLIAVFILPILLAGYFVAQVDHLRQTLIPVRGTLETFERKGHHGDNRKEFTLVEYQSTFVRFYEGANMLFAKNLSEDVYAPLPPGEVIYKSYIAPKLKPASQRQVSFLIQQQDQPKLKQHATPVPYFCLQLLPGKKTTAGYYLDLYLFAYRYAHGVLITFISIFLFLGCCIGASWWGERYKSLLAYELTVIVSFVLLIMF